MDGGPQVETASTGQDTNRVAIPGGSEADATVAETEATSTMDGGEPAPSSANVAPTPTTSSNDPGSVGSAAASPPPHVPQEPTAAVHADVIILPTGDPDPGPGIAEPAAEAASPQRVISARVTVSPPPESHEDRSCTSTPEATPGATPSRAAGNRGPGTQTQRDAELAAAQPPAAPPASSHTRDPALSGPSFAVHRQSYNALRPSPPKRRPASAGSKRQPTWPHLEDTEVPPPVSVDGRAWGDEHKLDPRYIATMAMYSLKTKQLSRFVPGDTAASDGQRSIIALTSPSVGAAQQARSNPASPPGPAARFDDSGQFQQRSPARATAATATPDHPARGRRRPASASASRSSSRPSSAASRPSSATAHDSSMRRGSFPLSPSGLPTPEPPKDEVEFEYDEMYCEEKRAWVSHSPSLKLVSKTPSETPLPPAHAERPGWMDGAESVSPPPRPPLSTRTKQPLTGAERLRQAAAGPVSQTCTGRAASPPKDTAINAQERLVRVRSARNRSPVKETLRPTPFSVPYQPNQPEVVDAAGILPPRRTTWDVGVQVRRSLAAPRSKPLPPWVATVDYATAKLYYVNTTATDGLLRSSWTPPPGFDGTFVTVDDHAGLPCVPKPPALSGEAAAEHGDQAELAPIPAAAAPVADPEHGHHGDTARQIDAMGKAKRGPADAAAAAAAQVAAPAADAEPETSRAPMQTETSPARGRSASHESGAAGKEEVPPPAKSFYKATPTARAVARTFEVGDKVVLAKWADPRDGVAFLVKSAAPQYGSYVVEIRGRSHDQADAACVTK